MLPSYIDVHFQAKPQHGLEKEERQRIIEVIAEIDGLIGDEDELSQREFPFPPPTATPIAALAEPKKDYIQCTFEIAGKKCQYICGTIPGMKKHCRGEHEWKSNNKGGRPKKRRNRNQEVP